MIIALIALSTINFVLLFFCFVLLGDIIKRLERLRTIQEHHSARINALLQSWVSFLQGIKDGVTTSESNKWN